MAKTPKEKEAVLNVYASMVRPLMQVAFEYGISASEIAGVVRRTYIQALESKLLEQNRPSTDARLAVVAGMTNSEVIALREALRDGNPHTLKGGVTLDQITRVLTTWHTHSNFSGAYGIAMDVDIVAVPGSPRKTFATLVDIACPGANSEALLDELIAAGSVEIIDRTTARCLSREYLVNGPEVDAELKRISRVAQFLETIVSNFAHNLAAVGEEPMYFERTVVSDQILSHEARDKFLEETRQKGQEFVAELDTSLTRISASDQAESGKKYGVAVYFFEESATAKAVERPPAAKPITRKPEIEEIDVLAVAPRKR